MSCRFCRNAIRYAIHARFARSYGDQTRARIRIRPGSDQDQTRIRIRIRDQTRDQTRAGTRPEPDQDRSRTRPGTEQKQTRTRNRTGQKTGYICYTQLAAARIHTQDQTSPHNQTREKAQILHRTTTDTVTQHSRPDQEPVNPECKTETSTGGWQKDLAFRFGLYQYIYVCSPLVPYILQKFSGDIKIEIVRL